MRNMYQASAGIALLSVLALGVLIFAAAVAADAGTSNFLIRQTGHMTLAGQWTLGLSVFVGVVSTGIAALAHQALPAKG